MRSHPRWRRQLGLLVLLAGLAACGGRDAGEAPSTELLGSRAESIEAALAATTTALEVRIALLDGLGTDGLTVDAHISDGQVTLTGEVSRPRQLIIANQVVSALPGITTVHNQLAVAPARPVEPEADDGRLEVELADELLEARVRLRLYSKLGLDAAGIQVFTRRGSVTLSGTLASLKLQTVAVTTAETTAGCVEVVDEIAVR